MFSAEEETSALLQQTLDPEDNRSYDSCFYGKGRKVIEESLIRKLDSRMSILLVMAVVNYITRSNIAAARLQGFESDLGLTSSQYSSVLSVFYLGYVIMQIPSWVSSLSDFDCILTSAMFDGSFLSIQEHVIKPNRPSINVFIFLCFTLGYDFVSYSYHEALLVRFLLGLSEAIFFPGALFFLGTWYKRNELSERIAYMVSGNLVSVALGPFLASGILGVMDGVAGYSAWRWLFLVEGSLTIFIGGAAWFVLPDLPESPRISWLTPAEHALAKRRIKEDTVDGASAVNYVMVGLSLALSDWKVWYFALILFLSTVSTSYMMYFPTLTATMGYSPMISLFLCTPPWLIAAALSRWLGKHSDKQEERCMHIVIPIAISILGFFMAISTMNVVVRYFSLFLMTQASAAEVCLYAWTSSTVADPPTKRAVALAFINALAQIGNFVGSYVWKAEWGPSYNKSYAVCTLTSSVCIVMYLWLRRVFRRLNYEMNLKDDQEGGGRTPTMGGWRYPT